MRSINSLLSIVFLSITLVAQSPGAKIVVLEKDQGEKLFWRQIPGESSLPESFILKVTPENSGSKHLVLGTTELAPGDHIDRHKHLDQDEILLIQTGTAVVTLSDKEYPVHAGGMVFIPARTWLSVRNTGTEPISLVFIFSAPGFEKNMRCASSPSPTAPPISLQDLAVCDHIGHVVYRELTAKPKK